MIRRLRDISLILFSAALLVLPYHFQSLGVLAFVGFIPYFFCLRHQTPGGAFKYSFLLGFLFFALLGFWLTNVNVIGFVLLSAYLALFFAFFGFYAVSFLKTETGGARAALYTAAIWTALEFVRGWMISGFPWALLGYSQWKNLVIIQIADIVGPYGVSFFVMAVNVALFELIRTALGPRAGAMEPATRLKVLRGTALFLFGLSASVLGYGAWSLSSRDALSRPAMPKAVLRVSVVQGNIPQEQKWNAKIKEIIFEKYKRLTLMAAGERPDLIVWPETSFPGYLEDEPILAAKLRNMVRQGRTAVLVGAPSMGDLETGGLKFFNSAILYNKNGEEEKRYSKVHLVPFGEYIPFEPLLGFLRHFFPIGHFNAGEDKTVFKLRGESPGRVSAARFGVLICYEDIFPGLVRALCLNGADFLVNITNDAWFGKTSAPYQHAQASVFRAVENRVPVVRSTNTGLSCFISAEGRILSSVSEKGEEIMVAGYKTQDLVLRRVRTFYTRFGDIFMLLVAALLVLSYKEKSARERYTQF